MAKLHTTFPAGKAMRHVQLTVNITGVRTWRVRLWLGTMLLQLAALVIGCGIRFDGRTES